MEKFSVFRVSLTFIIDCVMILNKYKVSEVESKMKVRELTTRC